MSKDKYPSIFSESNGGYCVHYPSNIFRNMRNFENWGTFPNIARFYPGNIRSRDGLSPISASENI